MQEIQDEEQSQGQKEVQEEEVVQQEHAPIQISHKTQIVDNFFDGPPPVKAKAPEKQNENTQTNAQAEKAQQQDNNENVVETKNVAVNQNIQQEAGIPQNQEVKNEVKSETSEPLPPIKCSLSGPFLPWGVALTRPTRSSRRQRSGRSRDDEYLLAKSHPAKIGRASCRERV